MSDVVLSALIVAAGPFLVGLAALITAIVHLRRDRSDHIQVREDSRDMSAQLKQIYRLVNGQAKQ